jgi:hypothetical protein
MMLYFLNLDWGRTPKGVTPTVTEIRSNPECYRSIIIYLFIYLSIYLFIFLFILYLYYSYSEPQQPRVR